MSKSYVTMEQKLCSVCCAKIDTNTILMDTRLRDSFEMTTVTGFNNEPCKDCLNMLNDNERIALVGIDEQKSKIMPNKNVMPEDAHRTGDILWIRRNVFARIFNIPTPEGVMCFVDQEVVAKLKEMVKSSES